MSGRDSTQVEVNIPLPVTIEGWRTRALIPIEMLTMNPLRERKNGRLLLQEKYYSIFVFLSVS